MPEASYSRYILQQQHDALREIERGLVAESEASAAGFAARLEKIRLRLRHLSLDLASELPSDVDMAGRTEDEPAAPTEGDAGELQTA